MVGELTVLLPAVSADPGELWIFLSHKKPVVHPTHKKSCIFVSLRSLQCSLRQITVYTEFTEITEIRISKVRA